MYSYIEEIVEKIVVCDHTMLPFNFSKGAVLDIGSRRYGFSNGMAKLGCSVWAVEPDSDVPLPSNKNIILIRGAAVPPNEDGVEQELIKWSYGDGNHLASVHGSVPASSTRQKTKCYSVHELSKMAGRIWWDVVKLDCEGSEYDILLNWPGPIASQITVEFHDFTGANPEGEKTYKKIFEHLGQWYKVIQHERYCMPRQTTLNYWDSLFVLKGLLDV